MRITYLTTGLLALTLAAAVPVTAADKTATIKSQGEKNMSDANSPEGQLQGNWKVVMASGPMDNLNTGTIYSFEGSSMATSKDDFKISGSFAVTGNKLVWTLPNMEMNYTFNFAEGKLIIEPDGSGQMLILKKQ